MRSGVEALIAGARKTADCRDARAAWARRASAAWREAHRAMDDLLGEAADALDAKAFARLCDAETAKVDAMMAQMRSAIDADRWPRDCYVGGI